MNEITKDQKWLAGILIGALALRLLLALVTPAWDSPDEYPHYWYAEQIAQSGAMPKAEAAFPNYESYQPPLYYLGLAAVLAVLDEPAKYTETPTSPAFSLVVARLYSVIIGMVTVWVCFLLFGRFPELRSVDRLTATAFVAFLPTFAGVGSSVSNDSLVSLLSILSLLPLCSEKRSARNFIFAGLLFGLAMATKLNAVIIAPVLLILALGESGEAQISRSKSVLLMLGGGIVPLLGLAAFYSAIYGHVVVVNPGVESKFGFSIASAWHALRNLGWSFWLAFGRSYRVVLSGWVYLLVVTLITAAAAYGWRRIWSQHSHLFRLILAGVLFGVIASICYTLSYPAGQMTSWGKNLFPILPLIALFYAMGWNKVFEGKLSRYLVFGFLLLMFCGTIWAAVMLALRY